MLSPAPQYRCNNLARARLLAADATLAGIEFVELPTDDALAPRTGHAGDIELRARVLVLHLPNAVVITPGQDPLFQGGVTITDLPIAWAGSLSTLRSTPGSVVPPAELAQVTSQLVPLLSAIVTADHVLVARLVDPVFNGIDFLEVIDSQISEPQSDFRQKVLFVHLFWPVPPELETARPKRLLITGGVRVTEVPIQWSISGLTLLQGDTTAIIGEPDRSNLPEIIDLLPKTDEDALRHLLVVRTDSSGDFSPYELSIVDDQLDDEGFNPPLFGFDSQLSRVTFSFKVECPSDFDCKPDDSCPPESLQAPVIDYLAKDYDSFRTLMLNRMAQTFPDWKERSPADVGVTIIELLAFAADQVSYFQDTVSNEAYLGTARHRPSLRRHARMLDYVPREGTNARTFVHVDLLDPPPLGAEPSPVLPAHTPLISKTDALTRTRSTDADIQPALTSGAQIFETMDAIQLHVEHNTIQLHTWGDDQCCLPKGAVRATLRNDDQKLIVDVEDDSGSLKVGTLLAFVEIHSPNEGAPPDPHHRHVVRLTRVRKNFDPVEKVHVVDIGWHPDDALPFPLCLHQVALGNGQQAAASVAQGNIVLADHGHSVTEVLSPRSAVRGKQRYLPKLTQGPMTFQAQARDAQGNLHPVDPTKPAAAALSGDPRLARPAVLLFPVPDTGDLVCDAEPDASREHWTPASDLLEAGPFTQSFVVEMENDGNAQLRFGDDELGRLPTERLFACYRIGNGTAGNIGAGALVHIVSDLGAIDAVTNLLPATGGTDPEPAQEIRLSAPQAFRVQERAVTEADYGDVARRHPGVQRALARRRFTGSWYTMFVAVDRLGGEPVDDDFKVELAAFLERFRLAGYDLEIQGAIPGPLKILLTVCVKPGFLRADVKKALETALGSRDTPGRGRGFFHPDNFTFGQPVFLSRLLAAALTVPGVSSIDTTSSHLLFEHLTRLSTGDEISGGFLRMNPLEIAQLDNDPSRPENGTLDLVMLGGS